MDAVEVASEADTSQPQPSDTEGGNGLEDPNRKKSNVRKRTKTGCLTCRKRRIKCDEGRPTCSNCIKSKRQCEGYNQRVIFKDPMGAFQGGTYGPLVYPPESSQPTFHNLAASQSKSTSQAPQLAAIAPKPPPLDFQGQSPIQYGQAFQGQPSSSTSSAFNFNQLPYGQAAIRTPSLTSPVSPLQTTNEDDPLQNYLPTPRPDDGFGKDADYAFQRQMSYPKVDVTAISLGAEQPSQQMLVSPDEDFEYAFSDDDASMADSDDEFNEANEEGYYGALVTSHMDGPLEGIGTRMRSFSAFAEATILTSYIPSPHNSPLNDNRTAAIFWHFVNVTGPSMSLYERHPFDHSKLTNNLPIPKAGHNIWTYTFPIMAFNHPALLQAMLALGALQIARLQMVPPTAAMKHYHLAIRRVAKNVQAQTRRTQPATLAATLLLAYFEVWNSDHNKWCNHLFGARLLFKEIALREMTRNIIPLKRARRALFEQEQNQPLDPFFMGYNQKNMINDDHDDLDFKLVNQITNQDSDSHDGAIRGYSRSYTDRDIEHYEYLRDLFWWYAKMDVYQSVLGGTKPFMEYEHWTQCPPRSPMGKLEAIHGTYDHLMLLLGRVCSFAAKDMPRKKKVWKSRGPPGGSPPMFAGMLPTQSKVSLPMGFSPPRDTSPQSDNPEDIDLEIATAAAHREWDSIRQAFEILKSHFGPSFQPLGPEYADRRDSPFGPTIQYRTFSVAGIWMNFYMGLIVLYRAHPQMPPVAMMAAGMQAQQTAQFTQEIGRISAGLSDDCTNVGEISTLVGAAFIESAFCLFVGAIQCQDAAQRHWIIRRMHDVTRLTGWQSARNIADGCESAWTKAAAMGRGPPYVRDPALRISIPASVWESPRKITVRIEALDSHGGEGRIVLAKSEQAHYALGLIGVEAELQRLELREDL